MKLKKLVSASLAAVMALSLGTAAFAADGQATQNADGTYGATVNLAGELNIPEIKVTVPTTGAVLLNPYRLVVENETGDELGSTGVMSVTYVLSSTTTVALDVGVIGTVKASGDVKIADDVLASLAAGTKAKDKEVFVYLAFEQDGDASSDLTGTPYRTADETARKNMLVLTEKAPKEATIIGAISESDGSAAETSAFAILGEAYAMTEEPWTNEDKVDATLIFSFTPSVDESNAPYKA